MSDAKKLLSKMLIAFQNKTVWQDHGYCSELVEECRRYLREFELEPKPEPLTEQEILDCAEQTWHKFDLDDDVVFKGLVNIVRQIEQRGATDDAKVSARNFYAVYGKNMTRDERIAKLKNGSETAVWAAEEIERLEYDIAMQSKIIHLQNKKLERVRAIEFQIGEEKPV